jgi:hypothetical protein
MKMPNSRCVHCGEDKLMWDGDFNARDFGYEAEGAVRMFHCMSCGARYEVFVPEGKANPNKHELEWLMEKLIKFCDTQPTYEDVSTCVREFAPHFIRWADGRNPDIWAGIELED